MHPLKGRFFISGLGLFALAFLTMGFASMVATDGDPPSTEYCAAQYNAFTDPSQSCNGCTPGIVVHATNSTGCDEACEYTVVGVLACGMGAISDTQYEVFACGVGGLHEFHCYDTGSMELRRYAWARLWCAPCLEE